MNKVISEGPLLGPESAAVYKAATPGQEDANNIPYKHEDEIVNDDIKKMIAVVSSRIMCMGLKESVRRFGTDWRTISKFLDTFEEDGIDKLVEHLEALNNIKGKPLRAIVEHVEMDEVNSDELMEAYAYKDKDGRWPKLAGEFSHKETNKTFEYSKETNDPWAKEHGLTHKVYMTNGEYRFAKIKGTVAYVAVDENPDGAPKLEKWLLKKHRTFKESAGLDEDFSKALGE